MWPFSDRVVWLSLRVSETLLGVCIKQKLTSVFASTNAFPFYASPVFT